MNYALVLAAGSGTRMGTAIPKQFLCIDGEPIYIKSVRQFVQAAAIDEIVLAVSGAYEAYAQTQLAAYFPSRTVHVIVGGETRSDTLERLVDFVFARFPVTDDCVILTHDAVRPFINQRIIADNIDAARRYGGCNTVIPAVDTVCQSTDGAFITGTLERSALYYAQTPQSFSAKKFRRALSSLTAAQKAQVTDACSVFFLAGEPVRLVRGAPENIKITYPSDLNM